MGKNRKGIDGIDEVFALFPASAHRTVERLLKRARELEARAAGLSAQAAVRSLGQLFPGGRSRGVSFEVELAKALRLRGDTKGKASIRQKAPTTGGHPFHFAHSVVLKTSPSAAGSKGVGPRPRGGSTAGAVKAGGGGGTGKAAAHMSYIEREVAVEWTSDRGMDGAEVDGGTTRDRGPDHGHGAEVIDAAHATAASAGQAYVENPAKLANGEMIASSFGTIGDCLDDRVAFWEELERAERHPGARVQHRLIVELPHEASPRARLEMMKRFCSRFEDDGVPYWVALHAPGEGNDSRNFHAHIVYSERPAKRMIDPADPDGAIRWDFAITSSYKKKSRNTVTTRPHMQNKLRAYSRIDFIKSLRVEFKDVVNAVLERDDVRDGYGGRVRYDARSYKDMGLDVVPMRSVNRIVADKVRGGKSSVFDGEYTKRVIARELQEAASRRQKDVLDVVALDEAMGAAIAPGRTRRPAPPLPKELRSSSLPSLSTAALKPIGERLLQARREALQVDVMERAAVVSLERVVAATSPKAAEAAAKTRSEEVRTQLPDIEALRLLHVAAIEELEETRTAAAKKRKSLRYRVAAATDAWRQTVNAPSSTISVTTRRVLAGISTPIRSGGVTAEQGASDGVAVRAPISPGVPARAPAQAKPSSEALRATAPPIRVPAKPQGAAMPAGVHRPLPGLQGLPTSPDLAAASATVSAWIKAIADNVEGADARMAAVDSFYEDLKAMKRAERAASGLAARSAVQAAPRVEVSPDPKRVSEAEGTPTIAVDRSDASARASIEITRADRVAGPTVAGEPDADTERRLKAREEELDKRRKQRKAVLGRRNRGKGIAE